MSFRTFTLKADTPIQVPVQGKVILVDDTGAAEGIDITPMLGNSNYPTMPGRQKAFKYFIDYDAVELRAAVDCVVSLFLSKTDVSLGFASGALVNVLGDVSVTNDPNNAIPVAVQPGAAVTIANTSASRVPVDVGGATIQVTATNVGINNTDATAVPVAQKTGAVFDMLIKNVDATAVPVAQKTGAVFDMLIKNVDATAVPVVQKTGVEFKTRETRAATVTDAATVAVTDARTVLLAVGATRLAMRVRNVGAAPVAIGGSTLTYAIAAVILQPGETWVENDAPGAAWWAICDTGLSSSLNIQTAV